MNQHLLREAVDAALYKEQRDELAKALRPFAEYAEKRAASPLRGLDDVIHAIHTGTADAAELRLSHCETARVLLAKVLHD